MMTKENEFNIVLQQLHYVLFYRLQLGNACEGVCLVNGCACIFHRARLGTVEIAEDVKYHVFKRTNVPSLLV